MKLSKLLPTLILVLFAAIIAQAKVTRIEITSRTDVANGKEFGLAGAYEKIVGKVYFAVDPNDPHNKVIVDVDKAPRNAQGLVEFSSDLYILRPKDLNRGNGSAVVEISNRGGRAMARYFNRGRSADGEIGDGFLMRQGFTLVWVGWEFDVADGLKLYAPIATDNGKAITGWVRSDFVFTSKVFDTTLGHRGTKAQPAIDGDSAEYKLTVRDTVLGERHMIPRGDWRFGRFIFPLTLHEAWRVDYGSQFKSKGLIANQPPRVGKAFPVMVPQVDADGIDRGGVRMPEVAVPLATVTGWNSRDAKTGAPD